jgi:hypothetical protein
MPPRRVFHQNIYRLFARRDHVEVGTLSRGVTFKLLSGPLQPGIRFFHNPLPATPTASLAIGLPTSETTPSAALRAYPVPYQQHEQRRSCLSTGGASVDVSHSAQRQPAAYRFGQGVFRCDRPALITVFISSSHLLTLLSSLTPLRTRSGRARRRSSRPSGICTDEGILRALCTRQLPVAHYP